MTRDDDFHVRPGASAHRERSALCLCRSGARRRAEGRRPHLALRQDHRGPRPHFARGRVASIRAIASSPAARDSAPSRRSWSATRSARSARPSSQLSPAAMASPVTASARRCSAGDRRRRRQGVHRALQGRPAPLPLHRLARRRERYGGSEAVHPRTDGAGRKDLGTKLGWVAVDHWNTDNPTSMSSCAAAPTMVATS